MLGDSHSMQCRFIIRTFVPRVYISAVIKQHGYHDGICPFAGHHERSLAIELNIRIGAALE